MITSRLALLGILSIVAVPAMAAAEPAGAFSIAVGESLLLRPSGAVDGVEVGDSWIGDAEVGADRHVVDFYATAAGRTQVVIKSGDQVVRYEINVVDSGDEEVVPFTDADLD